MSITIEPLRPTFAGEVAGIEYRILVNQLAERFGSARDRRVFLLHYLCGCTAAEIATLPGIGLRPKGVETLLARLAAESRRYVQEPAAVRRRTGGYQA